MKDWKTSKIVLFVCGCILLNFFGKLIAEKCNLPIWMDCMGTAICAYIAGPICGAIVGASVNLLYGTISIISVFYVPTSILFGAVVGICGQKDLIKVRFHAVSLGMVLAFVCSLVSVPINLLVAHGMTGNLWGDGVIRYCKELGAPDLISYILGEYCVELPDKLLTAVVVFLLVHKIKNHERKRLGEDLVVLSVFALVTCLMTVSVQAQEETPYYDSFIQTVYNNRNGIPGGSVNDIAQTRDGMLWLGTYSGLYQYDGSRFTFMSQFDSVRNANCLYTDEQGRLWIGTNDSGLSICSNGEIVNVLDQQGGLPENSVRSITKSTDGLYYVGTTGAMCMVKLADGIDVLKVIQELPYVKHLTSDQNGHVCAVTSDGALALLSDGEVLQILETNASGETFTCAYFSPDGELFAATSGQAVEKYVIQNEKLNKSATISCKAFNTINDMYMTLQKELFVCADNGIGYLTMNGMVHKINTSDFDSSVDNMLVDYQGNLWFSSSRLGLLELSESIVKEIHTRVGLDESVANAVTKWNGRYYLGTDEGLSVVDMANNRSVGNHLTGMLNQVRIRSLVVDDKNSLWIAASGKGVYHVLDNGDIEQYDSSIGLISDKTRCIQSMSDGSVAIGTDGGISFIRDGRIGVSVGSKNGLSTAKTLCLCEYQGRLYAGTDGGGIAVIEKGQLQKLIRRADGLSSDVVLRIVEASDEKGLYIVASNGLNYLSEDGTIQQLRQFPYYDNYDIIHTGDGSLWITCSAGVYIVEESTLIGKSELEYEMLDAKKGFQTNLTANSWNYLDEDGSLYLCGDKGVISIDTQKYDKQRYSFRITLENISQDGVLKSVDKEETNIIAREATRIEFFPKVINYSASDPYVRIWLEGFEMEPSVVLQSELESVAYTNLPCGEYTFHLAILDNKQRDVVEEVSYSFLKEKEIYDNWWFTLYLVVLLVIVTVYFAWLIVGSQIDKNMKIQKKELENLKLKQTADAAVAAGEAKDKFLALMSHDIRTPINAILGMNEMILRESNQPNVYNYAQDIKGASNTLLSLVNTILDFSKIEEGKMEIIPANYQTRDLVLNLIRGVQARAAEKGLELKLDIEETLPCELYGDDVRIGQIISNLLTNAVKYTREGFISLVIREQERRADTSLIYVEVRDSGIGIKAEDIDKMFESFQRLDEQKNRTIEGTGLGMSIVTNLLEMMDSKLEVQSEYGVGSRFYFVLEQKIVSAQPMGDIQSPIVQAKQDVQVQHIQAPGARILVVDDNKMNLKVATGLLKMCGIVPDTVSSGMEALDKLREKQYHIVFLDHMMPDMDGIQTLEHIRQDKLISDETKVIILTANAINGAREQYLAAGFDDYLSKPIEMDLLENKLERYLTQMSVEVSYESHSMDSKKDVTTEKESSAHETHKGEEAEAQKAQEDVILSGSESLRRLSEKCPQIDVVTGMKYCMNAEEFYFEVLREYLDGNKADKLQDYFASENMADYRVQIHSVKSNSMSIGAVEISNLAKELERAAKDEDADYLAQHHDAFMQEYRSLLSDLKHVLKDEGQEVEK